MCETWVHHAHVNAQKVIEAFMDETPRFGEAIGCPAHISILLHCYTSGEPIPRMDAPVTNEAIQRFLSLGVIEKSDRSECAYVTTPLGCAWVRSLEKTKLPRAAFIDERGTVLKP